MIGKDLNDKLKYLGMVRSARELIVKEGYVTRKEMSMMHIEDVCNLIVGHYDTIFIEDECIGLVKIEDMETYNNILKVIER